VTFSSFLSFLCFLPEFFFSHSLSCLHFATLDSHWINRWSNVTNVKEISFHWKRSWIRPYKNLLSRKKTFKRGERLPKVCCSSGVIFCALFSAENLFSEDFLENAYTKFFRKWLFRGKKVQNIDSNMYVPTNNKECCFVVTINKTQCTLCVAIQILFFGEKKH
jgi:hypothetical protein